MIFLPIVLLLTGCAGIRAVTSYTTEETERERAACLSAGGARLETRAQYHCALPPTPEKT